MYIIRYQKRVLEQDIPCLPKSILPLIERAINMRLATAPEQYGKPLRRSLQGHRRLRTGDWRIIYRIDETHKTVYVVAIGHRKDIYDE